MKLAVLSDIHCNVFALRAVLKHVLRIKPDLILITGDVFGYYPWAIETWNTVKDFNILAVRGNHDQLVIETPRSDCLSDIERIAAENFRQLRDAAPAALTWLQSLPLQTALSSAGVTVQMAHGTPLDPLHGRFFPDSVDCPEWSPGPGTVQLLGHTHWPLLRIPQGMILNPGSVGQPRDGDLRASWATLNLPDQSVQFHRTEYDRETALRELQKINWPSIAMRGLSRRKSDLN